MSFITGALPKAQIRVPVAQFVGHSARHKNLKGIPDAAECDSEALADEVRQY